MEGVAARLHERVKEGEGEDGDGDETVRMRLRPGDEEGSEDEDEEVEEWAVGLRRSVERTLVPQRGILKSTSFTCVDYTI